MAKDKNSRRPCCVRLTCQTDLYRGIAPVKFFGRGGVRVGVVWGFDCQICRERGLQPKGEWSVLERNGCLTPLQNKCCPWQVDGPKH